MMTFPKFKICCCFSLDFVDVEKFLQKFWKDDWSDGYERLPVVASHDVKR